MTNGMLHKQNYPEPITGCINPFSAETWDQPSAVKALLATEPPNHLVWNVYKGSIGTGTLSVTGTSLVSTRYFQHCYRLNIQH